MALTLQHVRRALIARKYAPYVYAITRSCIKHDIPLSAGYALAEKETGFRNVWGHDRAVGTAVSLGYKYSGGIDGLEGKPVTKKDYKYYLTRRRLLGAQGAGVMQLTWPPTQDLADKRGGTWNAAANIDTGIEQFASNYHAQMKLGLTPTKALQVAAARYNGSGPAAEQYGRDFMVLYEKWYNRLK